MENKLTVSPSPHAHSGASTSSIMWTVFCSLLPAAAFSVYLFGIPALKVLVGTVLMCIILEGLGNLALSRKVSLKDGSAALTGLILALTLPPGLPLWICGIGSFVSITVAKTIFGGLGQNPFNPAMTGRVFLLIALPAPLTRWIVPAGTGETLFSRNVTALDAAGNVVSGGSERVDAITAATPLGILSEEGASAIGELASQWHIFVGQTNGSLGETSGVLLLAAGMFLLARKIITWHIPVSFMVAMAAVAGITNLYDPSEYATVPFHLFTGGAVIGAWFMATDYVTSPMSPKGKLIFGFGCGLLTMVIRLWAGYPEGVSFAILLMNATVPIIDRYTMPERLGLQAPKVKRGSNA